MTSVAADEVTTSTDQSVVDSMVNSVVDSMANKDAELNNSHVLRQAQLSRELQELNTMLADKQELAGQMMRNDEQLAAVKLQHEVSSHCVYTV